MKLKLDLHPIFNDSASIEQALRGVIDEAIAKRASEVEIIPGKGSGALKKSVLRFLDRPEIKALYHRIDKDSDNFGRLFVYFRHERPDAGVKPAKAEPEPTVSAACACCGDEIVVVFREGDEPTVRKECPWCGSPNRISVVLHGRGPVTARARLDYGEG